jgi:hypothetical protein
MGAEINQQPRPEARTRERAEGIKPLRHESRPTNRKFLPYGCPRFTTPDEKGNIILDMCFYVKP